MSIPISPTNKIAKYGAMWNADHTPLQIELDCIRYGGRWISPKTKKECGAGLFHHYMEVRKIVWPSRFRHKWTDLIYKTVLENSITIMMGSASCGKSASAAELACIAYWASPQNTCVLVSSTSRDKLNSAIFGEIKMLWQEGKSKFPWLAGDCIDYKLAIFTDSLDDSDTRDERRGIIGKACYKGAALSESNFVGLGVYAGTKQENVWFIADELQFMQPAFLKCLPNMFSNTGKLGSGGLKVIGSGNPDHNPDSQLGIIAEPIGGWATVEDNEKTSVWPIKVEGQMGGVCINLIGTDSPNFDQDEDIYPRIIGHAFEKIMRNGYGVNTPDYESQVKGRNKMSLAKARVITRELCRDNKATEKAIWKGSNRTRIHACDPSYGGGDRCISTWGEFGENADGKMILRVSPPRTIRIDIKSALSPEDQIAHSIKRELDDLSIPATHSGYDSTGKGTIGNAFAKVFGHDCPMAIDSGQRPTPRPVRYDLFVEEGPPYAITKRLKRCDEEYGKFVTEMWFSARNAIEAGQIRELTDEVIAEGCRREYSLVSGNKKDVQPKDEMIGRSPDLFDSFAILVEVARRLGFRIERLGKNLDETQEDDNYLEREANRYKLLISGKLLQR